MIEHWIANTAHDYRRQLVLDFQEEFDTGRVPSRVRMFTSCITALKKADLSPIDDVLHLTLVAQHFIEYPRTSTRRASLELGMARTSLRNLKFRAYRPRLQHALLEDDINRHPEFAEMFLVRLEADPVLT